jgi:hypothetical protein
MDPRLTVEEGPGHTAIRFASPDGTAVEVVFRPPAGAESGGLLTARRGDRTWRFGK